MRWYSSRFQEVSRSAESLLSPAYYSVDSEPWCLVVMDAGRVSTYSSFGAEHLVAPCVGHGSWHLRLRSTRSQERTALFWKQLFSIVLQAWCSISRRYGPEFPMMSSELCPPSTDIRGSHRLGGEAFEYAHPPALSSRAWLS